MPTTQLIQHNIAALRQAEALLLTVTQTQVDFSPQVGPHLRHILDHYDCFFNGLPQGRIDYDARVRDSQTETRISAAQRRIEQTLLRLEQLLVHEFPTVLEVCLATQADDDSDAEVTNSTPARELQFLHSHAVHHYALIRMVLQNWGLSVDANFGKAPSTVRHERASA